jgi:L-threonylcarbamoyladenylate synthase
MIKTIPEVAEILKRGGVCAFPTETVYGLGAHPFHPEAIQRIFAIKGRAGDQPLSLHISQLGEL